jgi:hypothetical protein
MIQSRVERMRGGAWQAFRGYPHRCLLDDRTPALPILTEA